jgi:hypothetical protein
MSDNFEPVHCPAECRCCENPVSCKLPVLYITLYIPEPELPELVDDTGGIPDPGTLYCEGYCTPLLFNGRFTVGATLAGVLFGAAAALREPGEGRIEVVDTR